MWTAFPDHQDLTMGVHLTEHAQLPCTLFLRCLWKDHMLSMMGIITKAPETHSVTKHVIHIHAETISFPRNIVHCDSVNF